MDTKFRDINMKSRQGARSASVLMTEASASAVKDKSASATELKVELISELSKDAFKRGSLSSLGGSLQGNSEAIRNSENFARMQTVVERSRDDSDLGKQKLKHSFKPINQREEESQGNEINDAKLLKERLENIHPKRLGETNLEVNMRTIVTMDQEPMHFLQAL